MHFGEVMRLIVVYIGKAGITVDGHANYEEPGKDIICAAVSVLAQNLIRSLESLTLQITVNQAVHTSFPCFCTSYTVPPS